jgi:hypothetical protein
VQLHLQSKIGRIESQLYGGPYTENISRMKLVSYNKLSKQFIADEHKEQFEILEVVKMIFSWILTTCKLDANVSEKRILNLQG